MGRTVRWWVSAPVAFLSTSAWAYVWFGNPTNVVVRVDRPEEDVASALAVVTAVRMHACAGGYTDYPVGATVDLADPLEVEVDSGEWCGVSVRWGSELTVVGSGWTAVYDEPHTTLPVDENPEAVREALTPFTVAAGPFSGAPPRLQVTLDEL
jgi:hypothetical protein